MAGSSKVNAYKSEAKPAPLTLEERNARVHEHLPLVRYIASRIAGRLPSHIELDDLIDAGVIGLIDAIDKFDPTRKIKFKTYAEFRVKGAILDELRSLDWVPRSTRQKASRLERAFAEMEQKLGRVASDHEVVEHLGIDFDSYHQMLVEARGISLISLDELRNGLEETSERNLLEFLTDPDYVNPADAINLDQVYQIVAEAIDQLPEKERLVISLYYYDELTMKEIGEVLEITESRVSQIHTKAILRLRGRLIRTVSF
ncbi:MAG TPA: FliA/WhiG family RNA polymerase sigma factor [Sumerlaeia bacterium]|nr:FliA/WhiG family RNA polymerase sigma factor [Sumerlaeia bacterium]